eukprot:m.44624 g.44624  ORF g.44624 m.44624 type:complete len:899 (+) comp10127_c0_seq1:120-2816(+)
MPLRLDIKRQLHSRSDRVKCVDMHNSEPWLLSALYNGTVQIWNYESTTMIKSFEVTELPVRAAKFVERKNWVITGSDDMLIRIFNYNTLEKLHTFEAHTDYIRSLAVHPTQPFLLSSSDDMSIKLWDWDKKWALTQTFEGHSHYVMCVIFNPKDTNTFASASLDRSIKVWQIGASAPNFTLEGHEKGVNIVDYFPGGEKPYLISGADDRLVKIWDYQNKTCVQTLDGHTQNVCAVCFHPELPIILTGSEDGTVRVWHANTYRQENTLNYGLERVWSMSYRPGSNNIVIGYDEGTIMIKLGREEPAVSMDSSGKIVWSKHNEVQQANLSKISEEIKDGESISLSTKELGSCEIYPQSLAHSPNGRFVVVCGDGEYIIHTALNLRNKSFGQALDFVWSPQGEYAIRESYTKVKIFKNFKERTQVKIDYSAEGIFGGTLLGIKGAGSLNFYSWETTDPIRRIDIEPNLVYWSVNGDRVAVGTDDSFFVLSYKPDAVAEALASGEPLDDEGVEEAFDVDGEVEENIKTGQWVGDCFIYTNNGNRLNYYVGGEIVTISHLDRPMYLLGYLESTERLYLCDKDVIVVSYKLQQSVLEYQTAVMRGDLEQADALLESVPVDNRTRVAHFLEKQGFKEQALVVSLDSEHRFELALQLHRLDVAKEMAEKIDAAAKWKQLGEVAMRQSKFDLAEDCMEHAKDYSGLLLLYTAGGKLNKMDQLASTCKSEEKTNVAFISLLLQGKVDDCIELLCSTNRLAEAALFARSYCPSRVSEIVKLWKDELSKTNNRAASALGDPEEYSNLFPEMPVGLKAEQYARENNVSQKSASNYSAVKAERSQPLSERLGGEGEAATSEKATEEPAAEEPAAGEEEEEDKEDLDLEDELNLDGEDDDLDLDDEDLLNEDD